MNLTQRLQDQLTYLTIQIQNSVISRCPIPKLVGLEDFLKMGRYVTSTELNWYNHVERERDKTETQG